MPLCLKLSDYDTAFEAACAAIGAGGIVAYPTDTFYGLGCDATNKEAVAKLRKLKGRDSKKPLSIIVADFPAIEGLCSLSEKQKGILHRLLPGPYTFILPLRHRLPICEGLEAGLRVPAHAFMRQVSKKLGIPIVSTSANLSGEKEAPGADDISPAVLEGVSLLVDGGICQYAQGSTVIDLIRMKVLRKGAVRQGDVFEWEK
jgi:tRNA threonylcarbamoyl adenosine modification protein (Sua5/YciO/YrdC/YwlC family)